MRAVAPPSATSRAWATEADAAAATESAAIRNAFDFMGLRVGMGFLFRGFGERETPPVSDEEAE
jgi:hypothetical protein